MTETTDAAADQPGVPAALVERARSERWAERLMARDPSLWSSDPEVQETIAQRLGWLDAPNHFEEQIGTLEAFGEAIRETGFRTAIVPKARRGEAPEPKGMTVVVASDLREAIGQALAVEHKASPRREVAPTPRE